MNPHIKVINSNLWTVNFSYVGMGFIRELTFNKVTNTDFMMLTQDGKLIMNSDDEVTTQCLPVMKVIMSFPNYLLGTDRGFCSFIKVLVPELDKLANDELMAYLKEKNLGSHNRAVFQTACEWEKTRRQLYKTYIRKHWVQICMDILLNRKAGENNGEHSSTSSFK